MNDLHSQLADGDPIVREGDLPSMDADRIRRAVSSARLDRRSTHRRGRFVAFAAATVIVALAGAMSVWTPFAHRDAGLPASGLSHLADGETNLRQLQFSTPGGTRVFWTFHSHLETR
jgi:hypothetical protein